MTGKSKRSIAQSRVREDVHAYFVDLSGHSGIDCGLIADGDKDAEEHAEEVLRLAEEREENLGKKHDLDEETLRNAIEIECAEVIEVAIANYAPIEATAELIKEIRTLTDEEAVHLDHCVESGFPISFDFECNCNGRLTEITAAIGRHDGNEWQRTDKSLGELREMSDAEMTEFFLEHIETAIENHRKHFAA